MGLYSRCVRGSKVGRQAIWSEFGSQSLHGRESQCLHVLWLRTMCHVVHMLSVLQMLKEKAFPLRSYTYLIEQEGILKSHKIMTPNTFYLDFSVTKFCYGKEVDYAFKNLPHYSHSFHIEMQKYSQNSRRFAKWNTKPTSETSLQPDKYRMDKDKTYK